MKTFNLYQRGVLLQLEGVAHIHDKRISVGALIEAQAALDVGEPAVVHTHHHGSAIVIGNNAGPLVVFQDTDEKIILTGPMSTMLELGYDSNDADISDHWQEILGPSPSCRANVLMY